MKFELKSFGNYSDEDLLNELRRVDTITEKKSLSVKEFDKFSKVHSSTIRKRFKSWKNALKRADLGDKFSYANQAISKRELLDDLTRIHGQLGKPFTRREYEQHTKYSATIIYKHFKNFSTALEEAGIKPLQKSLRYSDEERFENLLNVWSFYGRQPTYQEMKTAPSVIGPKSYIVRWESWSKALKAFVEKVNNDNLEDEKDQNEENLLEEENSSEALDIPKHNKRIPRSERREIPLGLRYDVLKRDNFKCVICGNHPASDPTCKLHIDHILAWAKEGKTVVENLRTLCADCNIGKSDKD